MFVGFYRCFFFVDLVALRLFGWMEARRGFASDVVFAFLFFLLYSFSYFGDLLLDFWLFRLLWLNFGFLFGVFDEFYRGIRFHSVRGRSDVGPCRLGFGQMVYCHIFRRVHACSLSFVRIGIYMEKVPLAPGVTARFLGTETGPLRNWNVTVCRYSAGAVGQDSKQATITSVTCHTKRGLGSRQAKLARSFAEGRNIICARVVSGLSVRLSQDRI